MIQEIPQTPDAGETCHGTEETIPYCSGTDCAEWKDCHGDRLRGYSARASDWREVCGV